MNKRDRENVENYCLRLLQHCSDIQGEQVTVLSLRCDNLAGFFRLPVIHEMDACWTDFVLCWCAT